MSNKINLFVVVISYSFRVQGQKKPASDETESKITSANASGMGLFVKKIF